jgi:uncharacterized protein YutE (UPF0331/DUF86 family)
MHHIPSNYINARELLLDEIAKLNTILANHKAKNGEQSESYKSFKRLRDVMLHSYAYMADVEVVYNQNNLLLAENAFLKKYASEMREKLNAYEVVESELLKGSFDQTVERVKNYLEKKKTI